eukprot:14323925-Ditylum_brightwellii.AAC.1
MGWESRVPSLKQILEDMQRIPNNSILKRIEARGAVVLGCKGCQGRRFDGAYHAGNQGDGIK